MLIVNKHQLFNTSKIEEKTIRVYKCYYMNKSKNEEKKDLNR